MFNSITGTLTAKIAEKTYRVFLDNNGIEWEFTVPKNTLDQLPVIGTKATVYTWLYHKEDSMRLFGFATPEERTVFLDLITVEGVGPVGALKILSNVSADQLADALDGEDMSILEKAAGKKTAQKMMLKLKGKVTRIDNVATSRKTDDGEFADIITALSDMGFDRKAATQSVAECAERLRAENPAIDKESLEKALFREAIVGLS